MDRVETVFRRARSRMGFEAGAGEPQESALIELILQVHIGVLQETFRDEEIVGLISLGACGSGKETPHPQEEEKGDPDGEDSGEAPV